jgi:predicted nucleotidyltransferase
MRRDEATRLIESVLAAVTASDRTDAVRLVTAIDVFGSYARGALDPRDIDLNVEYDRQASLVLCLANRVTVM